MNPLANDLDHVLAHTQGLWDELRGQRIFVTGGTGFFGCWLLESFCWANDKLDLRAEATVLSRNPDAFRTRMPHLAKHGGLRLHTGDINHFVFPSGEFSYIIHAAADTSDRIKRENPLRVWDSLVDGTRRTLTFAVSCHARRMLFTSSGAVYGQQPAGMTHIPEEYVGGPDPLNPWLHVAEGKRASEMLRALWSRHPGIEVLIARAFAFVGPYLPLDVHYAIGNFIGDGLASRPIVVQGNGTPYRSYLYAADMAIWLWTILLKGRPLVPYNVGSEDGRCIADVARTVAQQFSGTLPVQIKKSVMPGAQVERYVPSTCRAREELGLRQWVGLEDAIRRTIDWHQAQGP